MKLKPSALRIPSTDLDASLDFYSGKRRLDFTLDERAKGFLVFRTDSIDLIIEDQHEDGVFGFVGLSFEIPDIQEACENLKARGVPFIGAPEKQQWGGWLAHFRDPCGNVLTLVQYD